MSTRNYERNLSSLRVDSRRCSERCSERSQNAAMPLRFHKSDCKNSKDENCCKPHLPRTFLNMVGALPCLIFTIDTWDFACVKTVRAEEFETLPLSPRR